MDETEIDMDEADMMEEIEAIEEPETLEKTDALEEAEGLEESEVVEDPEVLEEPEVVVEPQIMVGPKMVEGPEPVVVVGQRKREKDDENAIMAHETRVKKKNLDFVKTVLAFAFSQVGIILLCIVYAVVGANTFISMENPAEEQRYLDKQQAAKDITKATDYLCNNFWFLIKTNNTKRKLNETAFYEKAEADLRDHIMKITNAAADKGYDGEVEGWSYEWTFPNTLLFTITIMTTIGYGHICPQTDSGKNFVTLYAMIGMPLFMMFLGGIGDTMADAMRYGYSRICCRWCRVRRLVSERLPGQSLRDARKLRDEPLNEETYMPTNEIAIPIVLSVLTIVGYLAMGAVIFHAWEGWDWASAAYFCFITLSTVGFGDMVPSKSFLGYEESLFGKFQMLVCVTYCAMGLALLAMCMSLIQEGLAIKAERMKKKITGGKKKVEIDEIKVNEKRANYDAEKGLFVGLTFDSEDPVEQLDAVSIAPTEATEVDEDEIIADDADQENDDLEEVESEEVEEPENNEDDGDDEEAAEDMDGTDENAKEDDMDDDDMD